MCGLVGLLIFPRKRYSPIWSDITDTFTRCLVFNQERGKEATGIALIKEDSHVMFKRPVPANEFVLYRQYKDILTQLDDKTLVLLGHTREPTKGSPEHNANNHPILTDQVIGIHNGKLLNDDKLFKKLNLPRKGKVDSEIIFRIMNSIHPGKSNNNYLTKLKNNLSELQGSFTFIALDLRIPEQLLVAKKDRPLCLHYEPKWQVLMFSSRYLFLRKAFGRQVLGEALDAGYIFSFKASQLPFQKSRPIETVPLDCYRDEQNT